MKSTLQNALFAGIAGTVVMTIVTFLAPMMGIPKMSPPEMLSSMIGFPIIVGWLMHFMIGIIFALSYTLLIVNRLKISNLILKGSLFGFGVFIFAQIAMAMMSTVMGGMAAPVGNMVMLILGSFMGHVIYGIVVAFIAKPAQA